MSCYPHVVLQCGRLPVLTIVAAALSLQAACGATTNNDPAHAGAGVPGGGAGGACAFSSSSGRRSVAGGTQAQGVFVGKLCGSTIHEGEPLPADELYGFEGALDGCPIRLAPAPDVEVRTVDVVGYDGAMYAWGFVLGELAAAHTEAIAVAFRLAKVPNTLFTFQLSAAMPCTPFAHESSGLTSWQGSGELEAHIIRSAHVPELGTATGRLAVQLRSVSGAELNHELVGTFAVPASAPSQHRVDFPLD